MPDTGYIPGSAPAADSANLDRTIKSIHKDAILLEVSCVSHDLMQLVSWLASRARR